MNNAFRVVELINGQLREKNGLDACSIVLTANVAVLFVDLIIVPKNSNTSFL